MIAGYDPNASPGDCYFDEAAADRVEGFFAQLQHIKGHLAGHPLIMEPWQQRLIRSLFGWKREDGTRRYRRAYVEVPRKNGKTTLLAAINLYLLFADGEPGAEIYCAASNFDQAALCFNIAASMIRKCEPLQNASRIIDSMTSKRIIYNDSFLRPIPANTGAAHGYHAHGVTCDELHAWPDREFYDTLQTGTGARTQPICVDITTAGYDRNSVCWLQHEYARKVRDGQVDDQAFLPALYAAGQDDDWQQPATWHKANPNLGVSVFEDYLAGECERAKQEPRYENTFRRLHLNQWTSQETRWLPIDRWRGCHTTTEDIPPQATVYAGLDLSSTTDLTALAIVQPLEIGCRVRWHFYIPEATADYLSARDRVPYRQWAKDGWLTISPGRTVDYSRVEADVISAADSYHLQAVGYDPWNAEHTAQRLDDAGVKMIKVRQGYASLTEPSKKLEALVTNGTLDHGDNPIAEWMAENVTVTTDPAGNIKPCKPEHKSAQKIDGIIALVMALHATIMQPIEPTSVYEDRGALVFDV